MLLCQVDKLEFRYEEQVENLLENISFTINHTSKIGLIGCNGSGKSTLLKILQGRLQNHALNFPDKELKIAYLEQEPKVIMGENVSHFIWKIRPDLFALKKQIDNFSESSDCSVFSDFEDLGGYDFELRIAKMLGEFGFREQISKQMFSSLSGGEKTRLALGRLLLSKPDFLILDEPSNHLDITMLEWLENYLRELRLPFIVVSHDRKFLDNCVTSIFELENKTLAQYSGNYSFYKYEKELARRRQLLEYEVQQKKIRQLKKAARERKQWALTHQAETGPEGFAPVYESITNFAEKAMKRAKVVEHRLEMMICREEAKKPFIEKERGFAFEQDIILKNKVILKLQNISKSFDGKEVLTDFNLIVNNGERICLQGPNGSGKTTLFKIIAGLLRPDTGSIYMPPKANFAYYEQEVTALNLRNTILEELLDGDNRKQTKVRTLLGCLNIRKKLVNKPIYSLSAGERAKVALARVILMNPSLLLLDEPTNHLEISARGALEEALLNYGGTIIMISHDRYFHEKIATRYIKIS